MQQPRTAGSVWLDAQNVLQEMAASVFGVASTRAQGKVRLRGHTNAPAVPERNGRRNELRGLWSHELINRFQELSAAPRVRLAHGA